LSLKFSIIIVTWNALEHLKTFLPTVAKTDHPSFEILIADNASNDGSAEWIREHFPAVRVVTFDQNYGYCGGNNRAAAHAYGEILVFLNNDVETTPDWLQPIEKAFDDPRTGIVQPKLRSYENRSKFEYAGAAGGMIDWLGYPFCKGRLFHHVEEDHGQYDTPSPVFWASGAAFAIRKNLFEELDGFDEDFEFHMEEIDLCWRSLKIGTIVTTAPESVVYHLGGGSLPMESPRKVYYNYRNSLIMLVKNLDRFMLPKLFFRQILDGIAGLRSLLYGKPRETVAIVRAHSGFYRRFAATLRKRKRLRKLQRTDTPSFLIYPKLIICKVFLKGITRYQDL
jgi:GT2 family glycosyltransferase